jgi:hypothetical protein
VCEGGVGGWVRVSWCFSLTITLTHSHTHPPSRYVKKLYLLVLKSNKMSIKNAQRNIIDAKKSSSMVRVRVKVRVMLTQHPQPHLTEQTHIIFVEILGTHLATFRCKTLTKHTKESTIIV